MKCYFYTIMIAVLCLASPGCSRSTTHGQVNGSVTFDGQPLKEGAVRFVPIDGASQTASAAIVEGKYSASVPVGTVRIEYSAPKVLGKRKMYDTPDSPTVDVVGELIPARFNVQSELTLTITADDMERVDDLSIK